MRIEVVESRWVILRRRFTRLFSTIGWMLIPAVGLLVRLAARSDSSRTQFVVGLCLVALLIAAAFFVRFLWFVSRVKEPKVRVNISWETARRFGVDTDRPEYVSETILETDSGAVVIFAPGDEAGVIRWLPAFMRPFGYEMELSPDTWARLHVSRNRVGKIELLGPDSLSLAAYGRRPEVGS